MILFGSQSGTVPFDTGNIIQYTIPQYEFLLGTQPNVVILCINPFDDIEFIVRTIKFLESSVDCKVLSLVVFPMTVKDDWLATIGGKKPIDDGDFLVLKEKLTKLLHISICNLRTTNDLNALTGEIINYFASDS